MWINYYVDTLSGAYVRGARTDWQKKLTFIIDIPICSSEMTMYVTMKYVRKPAHLRNIYK